MTYLNQVAKECMAKLDAINIPYSKNVDFNTSKRYKVKWGQCSKRYDGYHITINNILADEKYHDGLENTLMHELLHTCPGCMNHGALWKAYSRMVFNYYGIDITRTNSSKEKGVDESLIKHEPIRYRFKCEGCGQIINRRRESKFTRNYTHYVCGECHGKLMRVAV